MSLLQSHFSWLEPSFSAKRRCSLLFNVTTFNNIASGISLVTFIQCFFFNELVLSFLQTLIRIQSFVILSWGWDRDFFYQVLNHGWLRREGFNAEFCSVKSSRQGRYYNFFQIFIWRLTQQEILKRLSSWIVTVAQRTHVIADRYTSFFRTLSNYIIFQRMAKSSWYAKLVVMIIIEYTLWKFSGRPESWVNRRLWSTHWLRDRSALSSERTTLLSVSEYCFCFLLNSIEIFEPEND